MLVKEFAMSNDNTILAKQVSALDELQELTQTLSASLTVDETLSAIISSTLKIGNAKRAAILLFDASTSEIAKTLVRSSDSSHATIDHRLNALVAGKIINEGGIFQTKNILKEFQFSNPPRHMRDYGPALAVPLIFQNQTIGILHIVNGENDSVFTPEICRLLTIVVSLASQFIHRAKLHETLFEENQRLHVEISRQYEQGVILGRSPALEDVLKKISLLSSSDATVMIIGESGTGKELVARAIHFHSSRSTKQFVAVNTAAIPSALFESELFGHEKGAFTGATEARKGKFELANGGTLFLDEISEMPQELQPKLLRVLENKRISRVGSSQEINVNVRVVTASSHDLSEAVQKGKFREALFHRLNVVPIVVPPLRERIEDIPLISNHYLNEFSNGVKSFTEDALELLQRQEWKGNIRELKNMIERISIFIQSREISADEILTSGIFVRQINSSEMSGVLSKFVSLNTANHDLIEEVERTLVELAIKNSMGNVTQAARLLGIDRNALQRRLEKFGITISTI